MWGGIIGGIISTIGTVAGSWLEKKKIKAKGKVEIEKAKVEGEIRREQSVAEGNIEYNTEAQKGMQTSWKDEIFVIVWLAILICAFIPYTQPYVKDGFIFLKAHTPYWFVWALLGMVVASFGLKGWKMWKR